MTASFKKLSLLTITILLAFVGGVIIGFYSGKQHAPKSTAGAPGTISTVNTRVVLSSVSMTPSFAINASDSSADHQTISVKKGAQVTLTFNVSSNGVYHGGLQFKSADPNIDTGSIKPGASQTVTFTAAKSFSFQPYWADNQAKKSYKIVVTVT